MSASVMPIKVEIFNHKGNKGLHNAHGDSNLPDGSQVEPIQDFGLRVIFFQVARIVEAG